jgi:hypothetical protein
VPKSFELPPAEELGRTGHPPEFAMLKPVYLVTRDLHLYAGLFISPFLVLFAVSVFVLVHPTGFAPSRSGRSAGQGCTESGNPA